MEGLSTFSKLSFSCFVKFVTGWISVGKVFPFSGKVLVVGAVREWNASPYNDLGIAAHRLVNAKSLVQFTVTGHLNELIESLAYC